ncbi:L-ascorbate metabolism protein UlaG (beta-lactamase superfamily) [Sphingomonas jinjuensis]|uniref:L-ascorbate metabolism protein UlaG (Beta-lactamase superfamily) n=1 Tax=Sphingomonas jinjuensis TaxID=535907 RepID=A0A840F6Y8_9SPHN|nr:MBL fold metallo-hydrolase [Sphingomonas jinjuensis]MBB4155033.1 L-ascorbate metabolism protein UlaG (beta-lactamase superfamily) [Sphingomonas jinjuensis]
MATVLKFLGRAVLLVLILLALAIALVPRFLDRLYYEGPASDHFDGQRFFNPDGDADTLRSPTGGRGGRAGFFWRYLSGNDGRPVWPDRVTVAQATPAARVEGTRMVATWVGHATVLVQTQGLNILTDPIYADRAGPLGFGPKRVAAPGIAFDKLPKIDLVLVSHNHYDHLDLTTLERLWERDRPTIVTSLGNDSVIGQVGAKATALDWRQRLTVRPGVEVAVTRNHHWGSRWFADRNRALWSSFVVRLPSGGNLFFAGDTGFGDGHWPAEAAALGPIRLALIPIGAFRFAPGQMGAGSHIGPLDAVEVYRRLGAAHGLAIHWGTFRLSYEAYDTPPRLLAAAMACTRQTGFTGVPIGMPQDVPLYRAPAPVPAMTREQRLACLDTPAVRALR